MNDKYRPRLSIEIRQDQFNDLQSLLDFGLKKLVFEAVVDEMIRMLKVDKYTFIAACLKKLDVLAELRKYGDDR